MVSEAVTPVGSLCSAYEAQCEAAGLKPNSSVIASLATVDTRTPMLRAGRSPSVSDSSVGVAAGLCVLSLQDNYLGPRGLRALLPVLSMAASTLHTVNFSHCNLDNDIIGEIARLFTRGFPALRVVDVSNNPFTYQAAKRLAWMAEGTADVTAASHDNAATTGAMDAQRRVLSLGADNNITHVYLHNALMSPELLKSVRQRIYDAIARRERRKAMLQRLRSRASLFGEDDPRALALPPRKQPGAASDSSSSAVSAAAAAGSVVAATDGTIAEVLRMPDDSASAGNSSSAISPTRLRSSPHASGGEREKRVKLVDDDTAAGSPSLPLYPALAPGGGRDSDDLANTTAYSMVGDASTKAPSRRSSSPSQSGDFLPDDSPEVADDAPPSAATRKSDPRGDTPAGLYYYPTEDAGGATDVTATVPSAAAPAGNGAGDTSLGDVGAMYPVESKDSEPVLPAKRMRPSSILTQSSRRKSTSLAYSGDFSSRVRSPGLASPRGTQVASPEPEGAAAGTSPTSTSVSGVAAGDDANAAADDAVNVRTTVPHRPDYPPPSQDSVRRPTSRVSWYEIGDAEVGEGGKERLSPSPPVSPPKRSSPSSEVLPKTLRATEEVTAVVVATPPAPPLTASEQQLPRIAATESVPSSARAAATEPDEKLGSGAPGEDDGELGMASTHSPIQAAYPTEEGPADTAEHQFGEELGSEVLYADKAAVGENGAQEKGEEVGAAGDAVTTPVPAKRSSTQKSTDRRQESAAVELSTPERFVAAPAPRRRSSSEDQGGAEAPGEEDEEEYTYSYEEDEQSGDSSGHSSPFVPIPDVFGQKQANQWRELGDDNLMSNSTNNTSGAENAGGGRPRVSTSLANAINAAAAAALTDAAARQGSLLSNEVDCQPGAHYPSYPTEPRGAADAKGGGTAAAAPGSAEGSLLSDSPPEYRSRPFGPTPPSQVLREELHYYHPTEDASAANAELSSPDGNPSGELSGSGESPVEEEEGDYEELSMEEEEEEAEGNTLEEEHEEQQQASGSGASGQYSEEL